MSFLTWQWEMMAARRPVTPLADQIAAAAGGAANINASFLYGVNATLATGLASWADANGTGATIAQATGAKQPTDTGSSYALDAVTKGIKGAFTVNGPTIVFLAMMQTTWVNNLYLFDGNTVDSGASFQKGSTPQIQMYSGAFFAPGTGPTLATWVVLTLTFNGASSSFRINENAAVTGSAGTVHNMDGFALGGFAQTNAANAAYRAVILCPAGSIDSAKEVAIRAVLYSAYGITP